MDRGLQDFGGTERPGFLETDFLFNDGLVLGLEIMI